MRIALVAMLLTVSVASARPPRPMPPPPPQRAQYTPPDLLERLAALMADVAQLEAMTKKMPIDPRFTADVRSHLAGLRDELASLMVDAQAPIAVAPPPDRVVIIQQQPPPLPPPPPAPMAMPEDAFRKLCDGISKQGFSDGKLQVLTTVTPQAWFTVGQVSRVLALFTFSADKLGAMSAMNPHIIDRENVFELYESFTFSDDKTKLKAILERP